MRSECERARSPGPPRAHLLQLRAPAALAGRARADTFTCSGVKLMDMEISPTTGALVSAGSTARLQLQITLLLSTCTRAHTPLAQPPSKTSQDFSQRSEVTWI